MMGWTLGRYFFFRYATIAAWFFIGIFALVLLIDFTELSSRLSRIPDFTYWTAAAISALRVPMLVLQTVPFVGLFAAMATLVSLNRKYELVVARAAGISAWQFLLPVCLGAFVFGVLAVAVLNPLAAKGLVQSQNIEALLRSGNSNEVKNDTIPWLRQKTASGDTIIGARAILAQGLEMSDATFFLLDAEGNIFERKDARRAFLRDGYWELQDVTIRPSDGPGTHKASDQVSTDLKPEFVQERLAQAETIPFYDLPGKIRAARSFGLGANGFAMQFDSLIALPFLLVAMTLIAATVSMRFARMGQSATMILGGVIAGFLLYVISVLVKAFGVAGIVPTIVAAWFPVVVAMFFGVTFLLYKEDG
ncbi:LPS export ABC transporter permease LptG [Aquamicrobium segne]|uniref:LPS export ABC transporter permease LptG n=1 Tax=Aquamicrobium segne TaxID=469547 RepID=A0ABW0GSS4_9HYPH